jgi:Flp pilus assembly protein TadB
VNALLAVAAGTATWLIATGGRRPRLVERVGTYLRPTRAEKSPSKAPRLEPASHLQIARIAAAAAGAVVGVLVAQGDLFLTGTSRPWPVLAILGAAAGVLVVNMHRSTNRQHRSRRLRFELPVVADAIALHVIAGESVATALERYTAESRGVAADELRVALDAHRSGMGLPDALRAAGTDTSHRDAARLYSLLSQAHVTGGRLSDTLTELARDLRAGLERDITAEGGRRALASYGPVLALMVPVALLFLLYPTLVGLRELAGGP